jgi:hypothetical protein
MSAKNREKNQPIDPRQTLWRSLKHIFPDPLFTCLIIGVPLLGSSMIFIGRAYVDFDLRLIFESGWFLTFLSITFVVWLIAAVFTLKKVNSLKFYTLAVAFLLGAIVSAYSAYRSFQYRYNDLGFYESRIWQPSTRQGNSRFTSWEWRLVAVKNNIDSLYFQLAPSPSCKFSSFSPTSEGPIGISACDVSSSRSVSDAWVVEHFGRPGEIVFRLTTEKSDDSSESPCPLPSIVKTIDHCPE